MSAAERGWDNNQYPPASVRSRDGTNISYVSVGEGPSVIGIPGALSTASDYHEFANRLGRTHTVHFIERRGRGLSGPQGEAYGMVAECEDIAALIDVTEARLVFGHSYGGLIALEAARRLPAISKVAVYEPGVSIDGSIASGWIEPCTKLLDSGKVIEAFAKFSIAAGPKRARRMPVWLMKLMLPRVMPPDRLAKCLHLFPTTLAEHRTIAALDDTYRSYHSLSADILMMAGGKTQSDWVRTAIDELSRVIPSMETHVFGNLDHFGPDHSGPLEVGDRVAAFFMD